MLDTREEVKIPERLARPCLGREIVTNHSHGSIGARTWWGFHCPLMAQETPASVETKCREIKRQINLTTQISSCASLLSVDRENYCRVFNSIDQSKGLSYSQ